MMYCWAEAFAGFFHPVKSLPALYAARDYLAYVFRARGFSVKLSVFSEEDGVLYTVSAGGELPPG